MLRKQQSGNNEIFFYQMIQKNEHRETGWKMKKKCLKNSVKWLIRKNDKIINKLTHSNQLLN